MNRESPQKKKKIQIMRELCYQRKTQNFENLKKWDQTRASKLIIHRKIVDQIDESLQLKLAESNEYTKVVRQYFTDLLNQKNRYLSHQLQNPQIKLQQNSIGRHIYPTASRTLIKLYDSTQNFRHFSLVKKVLEESLQKIDQFFAESEKQLMQLRTKIELLVLEIQDCNMQTLQKCDSLVAIYNAGKNLKAFQSQQDFFMEQQAFLNQAKKQDECQKYLGMHIVEYLEFVQKKQVQKLALLKGLIGNYINAMKISHQGEQQHLINLYDILHKNTESKYIQEYFSVEELLPREIIYELAKVERKHESQCLSVKFLKNFLKRFQFEEFDNRNLVLKAIKVYMRTRESGEDSKKRKEQNRNASQNQPDSSSKDQPQQQSSLSPVDIYITVDGFINIYHTHHGSSSHQAHENESHNSHPQEQQQTRSLLLYTLKISASLVLKRIGDIELEINVKKWGLMTFSSQSEEDQVRLIFNSEDQREEILEFIVQLR